VTQYALDHGNTDDRQHLLRHGKGQGPQPRPLAADEDHRLHYFVVEVVPVGFVVVVVGGAVVVDAAGGLVVEVVVDEAGTELVVEGTVVEVVAGAVVVVATGPAPARVCCRAMTVDPGGFGSGWSAGPNPTVISWRFWNLRSAGLLVVRPPTGSS
jgi:hypothetical protein